VRAVVRQSRLDEQRVRFNRPVFELTLVRRMHFALSALSNIGALCTSRAEVIADELMWDR
jgi:hypothetical protein